VHWSVYVGIDLFVGILFNMAERSIKRLQENLEKVLQESFADAKQRKIRLIIPLLDLMKDFEAKALRVDDMRLLRGAIADYLQQNDLIADKELIRIVSKRFSMAYLPGISNLGLYEYVQYLEQAGYGSILQQHLMSWPELSDRTVSSPRPNTSQKIQNVNTAKLSRPPQDTSIIVGAPNVSSSKSVRYFLCSFRRNQSALWTSYRLYLDGTQEISTSGEALGTSQLDRPIMLLGAKRLKGGISAQCFVWNSEDAKLWKEKSAVGKITRNSFIYFGIPGRSSSTSTMQDSIDQDVDVSAPDSTASASAPATNIEAVNDNGSIQSLDSKSKSAASDSGHSDISMVKDFLERGPVGIAVQTKGQEKIIQLTIAFQKNQSPSVNEESLYELEQLVRNPLGFSNGNSNSSASASAQAKSPEALQLPYVVLRSKIPRKLSDSESSTGTGGINVPEKGMSSSSGTAGSASTSSNSQSQFGVSFGKHSRIRYPSRKNLVADVWIDFQNSQKRVAVNNEWSTESMESIPLLQVGKIEEDRFAVDFHTLSPFQAFTIAMAIFDQ
jgi:hypothetical protein